VIGVGLCLFEKFLNFRLGYPKSFQFGTDLGFGTKLIILNFNGILQNKHKLLRLGAKNLTLNMNLYHGVSCKEYRRWTYEVLNY
jgi:hypothetical protein